MAVGSWVFYDKALELIGKKEINFSSDTFKMALFDNTYSPATTTDTTFDTLTTELSGSGYTAGGATLTNVTWDTVANAAWDCDNVVWTAGATLTFKYAVIYDTNSTSVTNAVMCYADLETGGGSITRTSGQQIVIQINASGIARLL